MVQNNEHVMLIRMSGERFISEKNWWSYSGI